MIVDDDSAFVVLLDADRFQVQPLGIWTTAHCQKNYVRFELEKNI